MNNPWREDRAFDAMFTDVIELQVVRDGQTFSTSMHASVFPIETVDPFIDSDNVSALKTVVALVKKSECKKMSIDGIAIGDTINTYEGVMKVEEVKDEQSWYKLTCRGKER